MKRIIILFFVITSAYFSVAQSDDQSDDGAISFGNNMDRYPPTKTRAIDSVTFWCGITIQDIMNQVGFIFEGRILTDSFMGIDKRYTPVTLSFHKVCILKEFKGSFISDTIELVTTVAAHIGDVAVILANQKDDTFFQKFVLNSGYIGVCGRKDIDEQVYKPLQKAIGHPYKEIHPNNCPLQKTKTEKK
jgi:hypothetical protein